MRKASIRGTLAFLSVLCSILLFFTATPALAGSLQYCKGMSPTGDKQCTVVPQNIGPWSYQIPGPVKATPEMDSESAVIAKYKEFWSNIDGYTLCSSITHEVGTFDVPWEDSLAIFHRKYDFRTLSTNQRRPIKFSWSRKVTNDNSPNACYPLNVSTHIYNKRLVSCADGWYPDDAPESAFCAKNEPYEDKSCPFGNPVLPALGIKLHTETDYQGVGAHVLSFTRLYRSRWPEGLSQDKQYWRHNWASRIVPIDGSPIRMVRLMRPDGSVRSYTAPVQPLQPWTPDPGLQDKLTEQQDGNANTTGWTLRVFEDDSTETYNAQGKLLTVRQRNGWTATLSYHPNNPDQLATITNHFGRQLNLIYDEAGRLSQLLPPGAVANLGPGNTASPIRYNYQEIASLGANVPAANQLSSVTWQDGTLKRYHYENPSFANALTGVTDEANTRIGTYLYNAKGQVAETSKTGGADRLVFTYGGSSTSIVDYSGPNNNAVNRSYGFRNIGGIARASSLTSPCSLCGNTASSTTYGDGTNANGGPNGFNRVIRVRGHDQTITFYQYNAAGQEIEKAVFGGAYIYNTIRPALNLAKSVISTQWHATYNLPMVIAEPSKITAFAYDEKGNLTGKSELPTTDAIGAQTFAAVQDVSQPIFARGWSYSPSGLVTTIQDLVNGVIYDTLTASYKPNGDLSSITPLSGIQAVANTYSADGRLLSGVNENGHTVSVTYEPRGMFKSVQIAELAAQYSYTPFKALKEISLSDGAKTLYTYDPSQKLISVSNTEASMAFNWFEKIMVVFIKPAFAQGAIIFPGGFPVYPGRSPGTSPRTPSPEEALFNEAYGTKKPESSILDALDRAIKENCKCKEYRLVEENNPKHGKNRYTSNGRTIARRPTNGQVALQTSVPIGGRRVGFDPINGELIVFHFTRRLDAPTCAEIWHGFVIEELADLQGRDDVKNTIKKAGFPLPKK